MRAWSAAHPVRWCFWRLAFDRGVCYSAAWTDGEGWRSEWLRVTPWLMWRTRLVKES